VPALTRWDQFTELAELRSRFDRMFDEPTDGRPRAWTPAIDVGRENGNVVVRADIPGIKRPMRSRSRSRNDILTVSGEHEEQKEENDKHYQRAARAPLRVLQRLDGAARRRRSKKIEAKTHDGVAEVTIPLPKEAKKETITITPTAA